jgi:hypothetical protein
VPLGPASHGKDRGEDELVDALRAAGHSPRWKSSLDDEGSLTLTAAAPAAQVTLPGDD